MFNTIRMSAECRQVDACVFNTFLARNDLLSADNIGPQFAPGSGSIPFDTLTSIPETFFLKKLILKKVSRL